MLPTFEGNRLWAVFDLLTHVPGEFDRCGGVDIFYLGLGESKSVWKGWAIWKNCLNFNLVNFFIWFDILIDENPDGNYVGKCF